LRRKDSKYYKYKKVTNLISQHKNVDYTDAYTEEMDKEGLKVLRWSMFDSPDKLGSGKMFMESEPVFILDECLRKERLNAFIEIGYTSKAYADRIRLPSNNPHRLGKAVKFKCINPTYRFRIVKQLILHRIERIHLYNDSIYFDTDNYINKPEIKFYS
tara:strand:- start:116 stop:589 length:474 start_codon:yes stop_codon:yes gene_type:complete